MEVVVACDVVGVGEILCVCVRCCVCARSHGGM